MTTSGERALRRTLWFPLPLLFLGINWMEEVRLPTFPDQEHEIAEQEEENERDDDDIQPDKLDRLRVCPAHTLTTRIVRIVVPARPS